MMPSGDMDTTRRTRPSATSFLSLAQIKNPPVVYARQANFVNGPQQVNNGVQTSGARENEIPPSKLLEARHDERLDTRAALAPSRANQAMETVGRFDRAEDR
jgi:hypothetical protein